MWWWWWWGKGRKKGEEKASTDGNKRKEGGKDIKGEKGEMTGEWRGIERQEREREKGGKKEGMEQ